MNSRPPSCLEIAAAVQSGRSSARAIIDRALAEAQQQQDQWRSFITLTPELARRQADTVDTLVNQGRWLPLAGVPLAIKDLFDVEGVPTTCGSKVFGDRPAATNATVIQKLVAAGAVVLGKANVHECAFGFTGENPTFGNCKNPWNADRVPGGSSSGSAVAVTLGICPLALGSDTGGSIRLPAALCGLLGLKPTYGRVSRQGVAPLAWSMDHVGPLTRTASEAALVLEVIAGEDPADETASGRPVPRYTAEIDKPLDGVRIGLPRPMFFDSLQTDVAEAIDAAAAQLAAQGAELVETALPHLDEVLGAHRAIIFSEAAAYHQPFLAEKADRYGEDVRIQLQAGCCLTAVDYLRGQRVRRIVRDAWAEVFASVDCLLTPTSLATAVQFGTRSLDLPGGEIPLLHAYLGLTLPFNLTGHPAASVPCGFSKEGLPIGMQIVAKPFDEATLLRVAHQYQKHTDWHRRLP